MNRYDFLTELHKLIKPKVYMEIGVQYGASLNLAHEAEVAVGVDPRPLCSPAGNQVIIAMTSNDYFKYIDSTPDPVDLGFIDGMHLYENALQDFINMERRSHEGGVIVFDDVLPYNQSIAERVQPPGGDWTGDVWKVYYLLKQHRPDLELTLVDLFPTGALVVTHLEPEDATFHNVSTTWAGDDIVPEKILTREYAVSPQVALEQVWENTLT